jgi:hypothetical protein
MRKARRWVATLLLAGAFIHTCGAEEPGPLVIADFNSGEHKNKMGGDYAAWGSASPDPVGICSESIDPSGGPDGSGAWAISYDISADGSFCGTGMNLKDLDASRFKTLGFRVKGDLTSPVDFIIELKSRKGQDLEIKRYVVRGVSSEWKTVQIPLADFRLSSVKALAEMATVFDKQTTKIRKGGIQIDDLMLLP